jgi:hypothetical protein
VIGWIIAGAGTLGAGYVVGLFGSMASDEVRGWLDIAPRAILRLAGVRLNREQRRRLYYDEWLPELQFIMKEAETRPITRAIRALKYALGLLIAARTISRFRPPTPPPAAAHGEAALSESRRAGLPALHDEVVQRPPQWKFGEGKSHVAAAPWVRAGDLRQLGKPGEPPAGYPGFYSDNY